MSRAVKPVPPLSQARIVDEAMQIADEGGVEAVSLRRLAARLGVTPMALYHHVGNKDELLDLMADRLLDALDPSAWEASTWQDALRGMGTRFLRVTAEHPAAPFLLSRPFDSTRARRVSETLLATLDRAGFTQKDAVRLLQVLTGMLLGPAIHRATYAAASRRRPRTPASSDASAKSPRLAAADDRVGDWITGAEADRITVDLWVAGVEGLANPHRPRADREDDVASGEFRDVGKAGRPDPPSAAR